MQTQTRCAVAVAAALGRIDDASPQVPARTDPRPHPVCAPPLRSTARAPRCQPGWALLDLSGWGARWQEAKEVAEMLALHDQVRVSP
jgi:hypothetical protein